MHDTHPHEALATFERFPSHAIEPRAFKEFFEELVEAHSELLLAFIIQVRWDGIHCFLAHEKTFRRHAVPNGLGHCSGYMFGARLDILELSDLVKEALLI